MSELDTTSYENHRDATVGDVIYAEDTNGNEYRGSVMESKGATLYIKSETEEMLEFRRFKDDDEPIIVLGIDGKNDIKETEREGVNKDGVPMTEESVTISFDHQIVKFESQETQHKLG